MHALPGSGSPAVLVLIAIAIAVAAYLRQVAEKATELMDRIQGGRVPLYPLGEEHTEKKLRALERTRIVLGKVAPYTIWFVMLLGFRALLQALLALTPVVISHRQSIVNALEATFPIPDFVFLLWFQVLLIAFYIMHKRSRERDDRVRQKTAKWLISRPPSSP